MKNQSHTRQLHYQITPEDYNALRTCLSTRASAGETGSVHTMFFTSYRDYITSRTGAELAAPEHRFSLSYYNDDPTYVLLERRAAEQRTTAMVTEAECRALLAGETSWILNRHDPVLLDFYDGLTERMLLPQMMVVYQREIYTSDKLDLCVALDTDIRSSLQHMDFLDPGQLVQDVARQEGRILMEVSYSDVIPDDVLCLLAENAPKRKLLVGGYQSR